MADYKDSIQKYIDLEIATLQKLDVGKINELMNLLNEARLRGSTVYIMGNGGSASTASHFTADFNNGLSAHLEKPFRFVCLNDNIPTLMAIANDIGYEAVFEVQLRGRLTPNDLVIGISGSGDSPNVLRAVEYAKNVGALTVGITGFDGGKLATLVDISLHVPVMSMQVAEDVHLVFDHLMMAVLYSELCGIAHVRENK